MEITGERVTLRSVLPSDFAHIVTWTTDEQVGHFAEDDGYPETLEQCEEWYQQLLSNRYNQVFIILLNDHPIGDIELDHIAWRSGDAELRIRIGLPEHWGKGLGTDAVRTLLNYAFDDLNLKRIYLRVAKKNPRAIRCYQKVGFKKEGKLVRTLAGKPNEVIYLMRILRHEYLYKTTLTENAPHAG